MLYALAACGSGSSTSEPSSVTATTVVPTTSATTTPSTTVAPNGPYRSALYGYVVTSLDWKGNSATIAWDGTGGPGNDEPDVDLLFGPDPQQAFAFGVATTATLDEYVAAQHAVKEPDHPCPESPEATASITIAGEPAVLDEMHCPSDGSGVFVLAAFVVHDGRANNFVTYARSGRNPKCVSGSARCSKPSPSTVSSKRTRRLASRCWPCAFAMRQGGSPGPC